MVADEILFRYTSAAVMVSFMLVRGYFSRRLGGEPVATGRAQVRDRTYYRLMVAVYILPFAYALTSWLDFAHVSLPPALRWMGAPLAFGGVAMVWWTHRTLGRHWSGILELRENHRLISSGPYRYIRHPMYTGFFMMPVGMALVTANLLVALLQIGGDHSDVPSPRRRRRGDDDRSFWRRVPHLRSTNGPPIATLAYGAPVAGVWAIKPLQRTKACQLSVDDCRARAARLMR